MASQALTAVKTFSRLSRAVNVSSSSFRTRTATTACGFAAQRPFPGSLASISTQSSRGYVLAPSCTAALFAPLRSTRSVIKAHRGSGRSIHTSTLGELPYMPHVDTVLTLFIMGMGLEQAPNTGRWRRFFLDTSYSKAADENKLRIQEWLQDMDPVEDPEDEQVLLVQHVMKNLLEAIHTDGVSLKPFLCDKVINASEAIGNSAEQSSLSTHNARSVNVHVSKQLDINAFAMLTQDIAVSSGMLSFVGMDEDLTAAMLAHELAHIIQDHSREAHGLRDLLIFGIQWSLWGIHTHLGPSLSCLPMAFVLTTQDTIIRNSMKQALEIEADTISLKILALAGYDPIHAARFYDKFAALHEKTLLSVSCAPTKDCQNSDMRPMTTTATKVTPETVNETMEQHNQQLMAYAQRRWYHSTHPSSRLRQQYLTATMHEVREKFRISEGLRTQPIKRFCAPDESQGVVATMEGLTARVKTIMHGIHDVLIAISRS
ncbi:unnamed protein product [Mortierella alpina]